MRSEAERQFLDLCRDIVDWGDRIPSFLVGMDYDAFRTNEMAHLAVWKSVEVLGEASSKILKMDGNFDNRYPTLPLRQAYAMRNKLSHHYGMVDLSVLWTTATVFVPAMVEEARRLIDSDTLS